MKRKALVVALIIAVFSVFFAETANAQTRVAVLNFDMYRIRYSYYEETQTTEILAESMFLHAKNFVILERARLQELIGERNITATDISRVRSELQGIGVDFVVFPRLNSFSRSQYVSVSSGRSLIGALYSVRADMSARIVSVQTGQMVGLARENYRKTIWSNDASISYLSREGIERLARKICLEIENISLKEPGIGQIQIIAIEPLGIKGTALINTNLPLKTELTIYRLFEGIHIPIGRAIISSPNMIEITSAETPIKQGDIVSPR